MNIIQWMGAACVVASLGVLMVNGVLTNETKEVQPVQATAEQKPTTPPVLQFQMQSLADEPVNLSRYAGKVILMVNTASKCGYTPQYKGLQELHEKYSGQGLAVLGFPANDFGKQEPGTDEEIGEFCQKNYGVGFDMFAKVAVTGEGAAPLYQFLTDEKTNPQFAGPVKWNFEKFLIGRDGEVIARFRSKVAPTSAEMTQAIETALAAKAGE